MSKLNVQLFLAGKELELNGSVSIPLNKSFENLHNPTNIVVEHSKSINVPISAVNNRIFANAYRLDKSVITDSNNNSNIGMYLNPTKKIPFVLLNNGSKILEGYAKFVSATHSSKGGYYTINLFGVLGGIFQELKKVVTNKSKLDGLDGKYLLDDYKHIYFNDYKHKYLNSEFVDCSWRSDSNSVWTGDNPMYEDTDIHNIYGFAPSHRGLYNEFASNKIQTSGTEVKDVSEVLRDTWNDTNNVYGADNIIGDGLTDYQMNQYRANRLKPYIYFNRLFMMYAAKCKELTDYDIVLDRTWFRDDNPYWARACYMFDYLDTDMVKNTSDTLLLINSTDDVAEEHVNTSNNRCRLRMNTLSSISGNTSNNIKVSSFDVGFGIEANHSASTSALRVNYLELLPETQVIFDISIHSVSEAGLTTVKTLKYWTNGKNDANYHTEDGCDETNFLSMKNNPDRTKGKPYIGNENNYYETDKDVSLFNYVTIPSFNINGIFPQGYQVDVNVRYVNNVGYNDGKITDPAIYTRGYIYASAAYVKPAIERITGTSDNGDNTYGVVWTVYIDNSEYITNWKDEMQVNIANLYHSDEPLFDVILQYTKMFGLVWDIDYDKQKIYVNTKPTLFSQYEILNWNDKIDLNKDMKIEPISFSDGSVLFNYDDVDGYKYTGYKEKYGVNIGEKKLHTGYEFNNNVNKLFDGIKPSSVSSKSYITYSQLMDWNNTDVIIPYQEKRVMIDAESTDEKTSIYLNNWYFRDDNIDDENVVITDDTPLMTANDEYCYVDTSYAVNAGYGIRPKKFPIFSTALQAGARIYGMFFNTPMVDYTYDGKVGGTINGNIYDLCWRRYINERYNSQNKKVTAYFKLTNTDYNLFRFNKFVSLNNQLFVVNKINNYDVNSYDSTQCELIQVSDIDAYLSNGISAGSISYDPNIIYIYPRMTNYGAVGSADISISGDYNNVEYFIYAINSSSDSYCFTEGAEITGFQTKTISITYESDTIKKEEYRFVIVYKDERIEVPIYVLPQGEIPDEPDEPDTPVEPDEPDTPVEPDEPTFNLTWEPSELGIVSESTSYGIVGYGTIRLIGDYDKVTYNIIDVDVNSGSYCFTEGSEIINGAKEIAITYEAEELYREQFEFVIYKDGETIGTIPITVIPTKVPDEPDEPDTPVEPDEPEKTYSLEISKSRLTMDVGDVEYVSVWYTTYHDGDEYTTENVTSSCDWDVYPNGVVHVSGQNSSSIPVEAVGAGEATITAYYNGLTSDPLNVTVNEVIPEQHEYELVINDGENIIVYVDGSREVTVNLYHYVDGRLESTTDVSRYCTYSSSDSSIATAWTAADGIATIYANEDYKTGIATITAKYNYDGLNLSDSIDVTVYKDTVEFVITATGIPDSINVGESFTISKIMCQKKVNGYNYGSPYEVTNDCTISTDDEYLFINGLTINAEYGTSDGSNGVVRISHSELHNGVLESAIEVISVTVYGPEYKLEIYADNSDLYIGDTTQLTATLYTKWHDHSGLPQDVTNDVKWNMYKGSYCVDISNTGVLTAKSVGDVLIYGLYDNIMSEYLPLTVHPDYVDITGGTTDFNYMGGIAQFNIDSNRSTWTATSNDDWINLDTTSGSVGDGIGISVEQYDGNIVRTGSFTVTARNASETVVITQTGSELSKITVSPSSILLKHTDDPVDITVTATFSNGNSFEVTDFVETSISSRDESVCTYSNGKVYYVGPGSTVIDISYTNGDKTRTATISVECTDAVYRYELDTTATGGVVMPNKTITVSKVELVTYIDDVESDRINVTDECTYLWAGTGTKNNNSFTPSVAGDVSVVISYNRNGIRVSKSLEFAGTLAPIT